MPVTSIIAFDIDLCRIHAWSNVTGRVCYNADVPPWDALLGHDRVLIEVPSKRIRGKTEGEKQNRIKWAIYNMAMTGEIAQRMDAEGVLDRLHVSPSDSWTLKYPEELRAEIAEVTGKDNHDLRECQCMLFFQQKNPELWIPYRQYLSDLKKSSKPKTKESK